MKNHDEWLLRIDKLFENESFIYDIRQLRSDAALEEISPVGEKPHFAYDRQKIIRNITAATLGLQSLTFWKPEFLSKYYNVLRLLATSWENLSKLEKGIKKGKALINAALTYELAGFQANAACLARIVQEDFSDLENMDCEVLASIFLQRLFVLLIQYPIIIADFSEETNQAMSMFIEGLQEGSKYFLSGNETGFSNCIKLVSDSRDLFNGLSLIRESNLAYGILSILPIMKEKSTWQILSDISSFEGKWKRYLKLLSRGLGHNILNSTSISELWPSQIKALESGLLETNSNNLIKMPTSAGKTRIAELAIVHTLVNEEDSKCIYVAPYRALVYELEQNFLKLFGDLGFNVSTLMGNYEQDEFEEGLIKDADILVITPEKLDLVLRIEPDYLNKVKLFILDEVQIIHDEGRGAKFEILMTRIRKKLPESRFLLLSAVVAEETLHLLAEWFKSDSEKDIFETKWRPSIQRLARFIWRGRKGHLQYTPSEEEQFPPEFVPYIITRKEYRIPRYNSSRMKKVIFPGESRKDTAAELAMKFAEIGPVLVFSTRPLWADAIAKSLRTRFELTTISGIELPSYFHEGQKSLARNMALEWLGPDHLVTRMLDRGVALHHGNLPQAVKNAIENDFRNKKLRVIIATNTLAQGVNLPIRTVIVHSCKRYSRRSSKIEKLPARDYWNIAGRAGRPGQETTGNIVHIVMNEEDEANLQYYIDHRYNIEPSHSALFEILTDLVSERISLSTASEKLDPEILALLVEETGSFIEEEFSNDLLCNSLVGIEAARKDVDISKLQQAIAKQAKKILSTIPNEGYLPVYSSTGLTSESCSLLREFIAENADEVNQLLTSSKLEHLSELADLFLRALIYLPEMEINIDVKSPPIQILTEWIKGESVNQIATNLEEPGVPIENLAKFIEILFCYKLPWGIAGFIRIACKELVIDEDNVSRTAKFIGSMIKYGVSSPAASWIMMNGVPIRKIAISLADKYLDDDQKWNLASFEEWQTKIDIRKISSEMRLKDDLLQQVLYAMKKTSKNPLLKDYSSILEILPYETRVVGIAYEKDRIDIAKTASLGINVVLSREFDNPYDRNAIRVILDDKHLGYLDSFLAQLAAPDMDCGIRLGGEIIKISNEELPEVFISISELSN